MILLLIIWLIGSYICLMRMKRLCIYRYLDFSDVLIALLLSWIFLLIDLIAVIIDKINDKFILGKFLDKIIK